MHDPLFRGGIKGGEGVGVVCSLIVMPALGWVSGVWVLADYAVQKEDLSPNATRLNPPLRTAALPTPSLEGGRGVRECCQPRPC